MGNGPYFSERKAPESPQIDKVRRLHGTAAPEPNQGARTPDSGAGGTNSLEGRGTMEQE